MIVEFAASAVIYAGALTLPSRAQSVTAQFISQQTDKSLGQLHNSLVFGTSKTFEELRMIFEECSSENWDGYGAFPVSKESFLLAEQVIKALPLGTHNPTIGAEPDGQLTFEWYKSPRRVMSISLGQDGTLHYAALLGSSRSYGSEPFSGKIPETIMTLIRRVPTV